MLQQDEHCKTYDLIIIGGVTAGFAAALTANKLQTRTLMVNNNAVGFAGTCVNVGCAPTKHLLYVGELIRKITKHKFHWFLAPTIKGVCMLIMNKLANVKCPIHDLLKQRWSPHAFSERMVEPEKLCSLFEAARWAPSAFNEQPWHFIVATKENTRDYDRLLGVMAERNKQWAHTAPVLLLTVTKLSTHEGNPNRYAFHDVGLAAENLVLQATALGLFAHQMAGFNVERTREEFAIPPGYEPVTMIAVGYLGDPESLPEQFREEELKTRNRKPLEEFIFSGYWGKTSPLVKE